MALNKQMPDALTAVAARRPPLDDEKSSSTALVSMTSTLHMFPSA
jgi:hypothetical protein